MLYKKIFLSSLFFIGASYACHLGSIETIYKNEPIQIKFFEVPKRIGITSYAEKYSGMATIENQYNQLFWLKNIQETETGLIIFSSLGEHVLNLSKPDSHKRKLNNDKTNSPHDHVDNNQTKYRRY